MNKIDKMISSKSKTNVDVKIPKGFNFDMLKVAEVEGEFTFSDPDMRKLFVYSDIDPLMMRNKRFIKNLIISFYIKHRHDGGREYSFLEPCYQKWCLKNLDIKGVLQC